jgi:hypothetical protein
MNAIILKGAALRQPPLPQSGPRAKTIAHPWFREIPLRQLETRGGSKRNSYRVSTEQNLPCLLFVSCSHPSGRPFTLKMKAICFSETPDNFSPEHVTPLGEDVCRVMSIADRHQPVVTAPVSSLRGSGRYQPVRSALYQQTYRCSGTGCDSGDRHHTDDTDR